MNASKWRPLSVFVGIAVAATFAWVIGATAGPLNPPVGAVGPTSPSLSEVLNAVQQGGTPVRGIIASNSTISVQPNQSLQLTGASGVLHAIRIVGSDGAISTNYKLREGDGSPIGLFPMNGGMAGIGSTPPEFIELNIRFETGLFIDEAICSACSPFGFTLSSYTLFVTLDP